MFNQIALFPGCSIRSGTLNVARPLINDRTGKAYPNAPAQEQPHVTRAILALLIVLPVGTGGFMIIQEDWGFWRSLYFTVITITTVGYGDYGLTEAGERFTAVLLIGGIGTATYAFGQVVRAAVAYQLAWRRKMEKAINRLRNHYIICGLGRVGRAVCENLHNAKLPFVAIEKDPDLVNWAHDNGYFVLEGCATEDELLLRSGIQQAKGVVCAVNSDSDNIVITLSARELNPKAQIVSRADAKDAVHKIQRAGASQVVMPARNGGQDIANLLIQPHVTEFLEHSHKTDGEYKLSEITLEPDCSLIGRTLRDYGAMEKSIGFMAIKRNTEKTKIRPDADETFQAGDIFIIIGTPEATRRMADLAKGALAPG